MFQTKAENFPKISTKNTQLNVDIKDRFKIPSWVTDGTWKFQICE